MTTTDAIIALGANRPSAAGEPRATLNEALCRLANRDDVEVVTRSNYYTTEPVGGPADQPMYTNAAAVLRTSLGADELLDVLQEIEADLGRDRSCETRFGPRTCDLDLLAWGDAVIDESPRLIVPHPRLHERRFVLVPLTDVAPSWRHPTLGKTPVELLGDLERKARS